MKSIKEILGSGLAKGAADKLSARDAYTEYAVKQQEQGLPAVSFADFRKGKR